MKIPPPHPDLPDIQRGTAQILSLPELTAKLARKHPLTIKLGVDPTAPDIHLGHTVGLAKLRQFQDLGHRAVLLIGDFTAMIGDPSGRSATRPQLTHSEVMANAKSYQEQAFKILDPEKTRIVFNGEWFEIMPFEEVIRLNSSVTLQQMLQREDFKDRMEKGAPIHAHEIQYPIMQGWDSVKIRADVEIGGTDQLFNILVGRDLQKLAGQEQQVAVLVPILEGLDGVQKMSKSLDNSIGVNDAPDSMFGKIMSISDTLMERYFLLLLHEPVPAGHPMDAKKTLARRIVQTFHGAAAAKHALEEFETRFSKRDLAAADLPGFVPRSGETAIVGVVGAAFERAFGVAKTSSEIRRLIAGGGVRIDGERITDPKATPALHPGTILKLDKKHAVRISPAKH